MSLEQLIIHTTSDGWEMNRYDFFDYIYDKSSASGICQFIEAGTHAGNGYAKYMDGNVSDVNQAFTFLITKFGDPESMNSPESLSYCSNLDPSSSDFLGIALLKGLDDLVMDLLSDY